ncbi:hypothetical protein JOD55_001624 [Arcanobacterium pluranimalium]|nr:hypothetical protein [Arcanobacterium pluranimalium]
MAFVRWNVAVTVLWSSRWAVAPKAPLTVTYSVRCTVRSTVLSSVRPDITCLFHLPAQSKLDGKNNGPAHP